MEFAEHRVQMLFNCLQTQTGIFSDLFVAASFAGESRNLSFPPCERRESRQTENLRLTKDSGVTPQILARNEEMWSRDPGRFDLRQLNYCPQISRLRVLHLFLYKFCLSPRLHL